MLSSGIRHGLDSGILFPRPFDLMGRFSLWDAVTQVCVFYIHSDIVQV